MTEAEWLAAANIFPMLQFLLANHRVNRSKAGRRKARLVGCACCRHAWPLFAEEPECAALVLEAERLADGDSSRQTLARLADALPPVQSDGLGFHLFAGPAARMVADTNVVIAAQAVAQTVAEGIRHAAARSGVSPLTDRRQADMMRDIFGNPFRPVTADPSWLTPTVVALARQIYDTRDSTSMPILADALQDAGCDNADVLGHCLGAVPHERGCWVVDLVLRKA